MYRINDIQIIYCINDVQMIFCLNNVQLIQFHIHSDMMHVCSVKFVLISIYLQVCLFICTVTLAGGFLC